MLTRERPPVDAGRDLGKWTRLPAIGFEFLENHGASVVSNTSSTAPGVNELWPTSFGKKTASANCMSRLFVTTTSSCATGSPRLIAFALANLAQLKLRTRDYESASGFASEALRLARATQSRWSIKHIVGIAALVRGHRGDVKQAVRLLAAVDPSTNWTGEVVSLTYHDPAAYSTLRARARQQLGDAAYNAAVAEAGTLSVDQAADLAQVCLPLKLRGVWLFPRWD